MTYPPTVNLEKEVQFHELNCCVALNTTLSSTAWLPIEELLDGGSPWKQFSELDIVVLETIVELPTVTVLTDVIVSTGGDDIVVGGKFTLAKNPREIAIVTAIAAPTNIREFCLKPRHSGTSSHIVLRFRTNCSW